MTAMPKRKSVTRLPARAARQELYPAPSDSDQSASAYNRSLIEASLDPLVTIGADGKLTDVNAAAEGITGRLRAELIGTDFSDYFTEPDKARAGYQQVFREGFVRDYPLEVRHRDGRVTPVLYNASVYRNDQGKVLGVFAAARDITERKLVESRQRAVSAYARSLIEASLDPLVTVSPEGRITDVNQATELVTGIPRQQLIGTDFSDYFTEPSKAREGYQEVFSRGFVKDYPLAIRHATGRITDVLYNASLYKDDSGKVLGVFAAARDVTQRKMAEELQRASSVYARSLIEASLDPLVTINADGKITDANKASVEATGLPREQLVGTDFSNYFTEPEKARAGYQRVFREGFVRDYPLELRHSVGRVMPVRYNASIYKNERGEVSGVFAAARDITERKRAEAELNRVNRALRATSACNQVLVHASDEDALLREICQIIVAEGGYRMAWVGFAEDDAAKTVRPVAVAGHDDGYVGGAHVTWADDEHGRGPTGRAIRTGRPSICQDMLSDSHFAPWREAARQRGFVSSIVLPLLRDGRVFGALSIYASEPDAFDEQEAKWLLEMGEDLAFGVTALRERARRTQAEAALQKSEQRFRDVLDKLPAYVVLLTRDYHVPFENKFFRERFGEARGRRCYEYLFNRTEPCTICESFKPFDTHAPHRWEWLGLDGRNYDIHDFPFTDADGAALILEMGLDITELKRAEQAVRSVHASLEQRVRDRTAELETVNRELESFSYSVSHDLRAPLRGIDGFSRIILRDQSAALDASGRENLQRIRAATQRMATLIDDLLQLSRTARAEFHRTSIDLALVARMVAKELSATEPERRVTWDIAPALPVLADAALARIVLDNLLGNAWKFTRRRSEARIEFGAMEHDGERVFAVRDNGAGFDMRYVAKLFGVFQRLHTSEEFPGTGIGLATVQRIVHRHGGRIWAEGQVEAGATFYFTLPEGGSTT